MQEQDEQLELVSGSIRVLKDMSGRIGDELDEQAVWVQDARSSGYSGSERKLCWYSHSAPPLLLLIIWNHPHKEVRWRHLVVQTLEPGRPSPRELLQMMSSCVSRPTLSSGSRSKLQKFINCVYSWLKSSKCVVYIDFSKKIVPALPGVRTCCDDVYIEELHNLYTEMIRWWMKIVP